LPTLLLNHGMTIVRASAFTLMRHAALASATDDTSQREPTALAAQTGRAD
jgi:hypothetical protein